MAANPFAAADAFGQARIEWEGEASPTELCASVEAAGEMLDGLLRGVPVVLKDLDGLEVSARYQADMRSLGDGGSVPTRSTCLLVERFKVASRVAFERTIAPEQGVMPSSVLEVDRPLHTTPDAGRSAAIVPLMAPFNVSNQSAMSLPPGWSASDLSFGVQKVTRQGVEDVLIPMASQLEAAMRRATGACPSSAERSPRFARTSDHVLPPPGRYRPVG